MKLKDNLISEKFFPETISVDISRIFPVMVLATMSSGKSTLINALFGTEILPSKNAACTAKVYSILDDDMVQVPRLYLTFRDGNTEVVEKDLPEALEKANENDEVEDIFISGQIKGVLNTDKALLLIDTPGPNNSQDESHAKLMQTTLDKLQGGLVLYIINATQMGIKDDHKNLMVLKKHINAHPGIKVLFLMNKVDEIDFEKESIQDVINDTKKYIEEVGISSPDILPVSALAANLFKMVLGNELLTRKQERTFLKCYEMFQTSDIRLTSYAITDDLGNQNEKRYVGKQEYTVAELTAALENTGILYLEKYIQKEQILSSGDNEVRKIYKQKNRKPQELFSIQYNPYSEKIIFLRNGERINSTKKEWYISKKMYELYKRQEEWNGLAEEITSVCDSKEIWIHFEGRTTEFEALENHINQYGGTTEFHMEFEEKSDKELLEEAGLFWGKIENKAQGK